MNTKTLVPAIAAAVLAVACGGGSGSGSTTNDTTGGTGGGTGTSGSTKTTPGVWQGTVTSSISGTTSMIGLTNASGHSVWMTTDGRVWAGQMPMTGTRFDAKMAGYMYPGSQFPDGTNYGMWSMTGDYANGTWSGQLGGSGDSGRFQFGMSTMWNRPASLDLLAGTYTRTTSIGYTMTMSITQAGELTANDTRGCLINGTVTVPDPMHNFYQVDATVTSCGVLDGTYQGHGTLVDANAMQSWMTTMGCFQYGQNGMMGGGGMMGRWWPYNGTNTVPSGTGNLFMFAVTNGRYAMMDALAK